MFYDVISKLFNEVQGDHISYSLAWLQQLCILQSTLYPVTFIKVQVCIMKAV
jgi:hypothetical protein